jgi:hypothetical protein
LAAIQKALPVSLIATPRDEFHTCLASDKIADALARYPDIDHLPVVRTGEAATHIIGLFNAHEFWSADTKGLVEENFSPLSEEHLIGSDAAIMDFILSGDVHSCRLLVANTKIVGLVTLSDLQKLPVRAALFSMLTQLEMSMLETIKREFPDGEGWMNRLSEGRQKNVRDQVAVSMAGDALVDPLLFTQFCDKVTIVRRSPKFEGSKSRFEGEMDVARKLRDRLAHANHYASTRDEAASLCDAVRRIDEWIEALSQPDLIPAK